MTDLDLAEYASTGSDEYENLPSFTFKRVDREVKGKKVLGDGFTGRLLAGRNVTTKYGDKLVIEVELTEESRGGVATEDTDDDGNEMVKYTNFPADTRIELWVTIGKGTGIDALLGAMKEATGSSRLDLGGTLTYRLAGHKATGQKHPLNLFEATYTPAVRSTSLDELE